MPRVDLLAFNPLALLFGFLIRTFHPSLEFSSNKLYALKSKLLDRNGTPLTTLPRHLPAHIELHMGIKERHHRGSGCPPAADSGADEAFLLAVAHDFDEARLLAVHFIHILRQLLLQLLCQGEDTDSAYRGAGAEGAFYMN